MSAAQHVTFLKCIFVIVVISPEELFDDSKTKKIVNEPNRSLAHTEDIMDFLLPYDRKIIILRIYIYLS